MPKGMPYPKSKPRPASVPAKSKPRPASVPAKTKPKGY